MTYPDPFDTTSPWDEQTSSTAKAAPETSPPVPSGTKVRVTLKGGSGYDAPWITVDGTSMKDAVRQLSDRDTVRELIDLTAKIGGYFASTSPKSAANAVPKRFEAGKVVPAPTPAESDDTCRHGRKLVEKATWAAQFCQAPDKSDQCEPLWRQKDGSFRAK